MRPPPELPKKKEEGEISDYKSARADAMAANRRAYPTKALPSTPNIHKAIGAHAIAAEHAEKPADKAFHERHIEALKRHAAAHAARFPSKSEPRQEPTGKNTLRMDEPAPQPKPAPKVHTKISGQPAQWGKRENAAVFHESVVDKRLDEIVRHEPRKFGRGIPGEIRPGRDYVEGSVAPQAYHAMHEGKSVGYRIQTPKYGWLTN